MLFILDGVTTWILLKRKLLLSDELCIMIGIPGCMKFSRANWEVSANFVGMVHRTPIVRQRSKANKYRKGILKRTLSGGYIESETIAEKRIVVCLDLLSATIGLVLVDLLNCLFSNFLTITAG